MRKPPLDESMAYSFRWHQRKGLTYTRTQRNREARRIHGLEVRWAQERRQSPKYKASKRNNRRLWKRWKADVRKQNAELQGDSYYLHLPNMELLYERTTT